MTTSPTTRFLIQAESVNGQLLPTEDFGFTAIQAVRYNNWYYDEEKYSFKLIAADELPSLYLSKNDVPIGSIEFAHTIFERQGLRQQIKPLNIPHELLQLCKRRAAYITTLRHLEGKWYIKSADKVKDPSNGMRILPAEEDGNFFVSEYRKEVLSEWRAFVHNKKLVTIKCYLGDEWILPNKAYVNEAIERHSLVQSTFTIDFMVGNNWTDILELHNFYSCGLYGFEDLSLLPKMWIAGARGIRAL